MRCSADARPTLEKPRAPRRARARGTIDGIALPMCVCSRALCLPRAGPPAVNHVSDRRARNRATDHAAATCRLRRAAPTALRRRRI
eukprot:354296-Chlamydomonas_euryale.AAC.5